MTLFDNETEVTGLWWLFTLSYLTESRVEELLTDYNKVLTDGRSCFRRMRGSDSLRWGPTLIPSQIPSTILYLGSLSADELLDFAEPYLKASKLALRALEFYQSIMEVIKKVMKISDKLDSYLDKVRSVIHRLKDTRGVTTEALRLRTHYARKKHDPRNDDMVSPLLKKESGDFYIGGTAYRNTEPDQIINMNRLVSDHDQAHSSNSIFMTQTKHDAFSDFNLPVEEIRYGSHLLAVPTKYRDELPLSIWLNIPFIKGRNLRAKWFVDRQSLLLYLTFAPRSGGAENDVLSEFSSFEPVTEEAVYKVLSDIDLANKELGKLYRWNKQTEVFIKRWLSDLKSILDVLLKR